MKRDLPEQHEPEKAGPFLWSPRQIVEGKARVIWSNDFGNCSWFAPGGASTTDERVARQWAKQMDALMRKAG